MTSTWQQIMADAITDPIELLTTLGLDTLATTVAAKAAISFPLRVPRPFVTRMKRGDANDPLLRQVLPVTEELTLAEGYQLDPLAEAQRSPVPGLLHKYQGRVLMIATGACAVHCRYCFRRHFPYAEHISQRNAWADVLQYLHNQTDVHELILSGGDPLSLSDRRLAELVTQLVEIPHLKTLRLHTRLPIVIPDRITTELLSWFTGNRLRPVLVLHSNHAQELDETVATALAKLQQAGVLLLNQAVLLRGVNDNIPALWQLSERLLSLGVFPYYLHVLDPVQGAAHFAVAPEQAISLWRELQAQVPGYYLPRLVKEEVGKMSKTILC